MGDVRSTPAVARKRLQTTRYRSTAIDFSIHKSTYCTYIKGSVIQLRNAVLRRARGNVNIALSRWFGATIVSIVPYQLAQERELAGEVGLPPPSLHSISRTETVELNLTSDLKINELARIFSAISATAAAAASRVN